jgi:hypothetical protein
VECPRGGPPGLAQPFCIQSCHGREFPGGAGAATRRSQPITESAKSARVEIALRPPQPCWTKREFPATRLISATSATATIPRPARPFGASSIGLPSRLTMYADFRPNRQPHHARECELNTLSSRHLSPQAPPILRISFCTPSPCRGDVSNLYFNFSRRCGRRTLVAFIVPRARSTYRQGLPLITYMFAYPRPEKVVLSVPLTCRRNRARIRDVASACI